MPYYPPLKRLRGPLARVRVTERLLALREQLREDVLDRCSTNSLRLATWNIRDFDSNKFGHGRRLPESFHYIAEIIATFDLVAVQEVNRDLTGLNKLMRLLGSDWDYIATDTTEGSSGNAERMAFLYDRRKVTFQRIAGEVVLPQGQKVVARQRQREDDPPAEEDELQFARTPFMVSFQAGWFRFNLCTVHLYYGAASGRKLERRIEEIRRLAIFFAKRQARSSEEYILLGDFNIVSPEHRTMEALESNGFTIPENLKRERSNLRGDMHYDQIAMKVVDQRLQIGASGVFSFVRSVFRNQDFDAYFDHMPAAKRDFQLRGAQKGQPRSDASKRAYYRDLWRTWQISDHLPMWVELEVDFADDYLRRIKEQALAAS